MHVASVVEKAMAPHSSTIAWKIPWMEEPGRLQSMGSQRVRHDWVTSLSLFSFMRWRRKWNPTPAFLPGESQGQEPGGLPSMGPHRVGHDWSDLAAAAAASVVSNSFVTLWTVTHQAALSVGFTRQEYWSGLSFPPLGDFPDPEIESKSFMSPALAGEFFTTSVTWVIYCQFGGILKREVNHFPFDSSCF